MPINFVLCVRVRALLMAYTIDRQLTIIDIVK